MHGQAGVAPNGIELHPVVDISFPAAPTITSVSTAGKNLVITGEGFDAGAVIFMDREQRRTIRDDDPSILVGKKLLKQIEPGQTVRLQIRNLDGALSNELQFMRPGG